VSGSCLARSAGRILRQDAFAVSVDACDTDAASACFRHAVGDPGSAMDRSRLQACLQSRRRFHDEMQPSIRSDQQREVVGLRTVVRPGNVEYSLSVLEESVHCGTYRLAGGRFENSLKNRANAEAVFVQQFSGVIVEADEIVAGCKSFCEVNRMFFASNRSFDRAAPNGGANRIDHLRA
jgi:hypothetical protein